MPKFNTGYDRDTSGDFEKVDPTRIVDDTDYVPLPELIARFLRGDNMSISSNASELSYDFDHTVTDDDVRSRPIDPVHSDDFDLSDLDEIRSVWNERRAQRSNAEQSTPSHEDRPEDNIRDNGNSTK